MLNPRTVASVLASNPSINRQRVLYAVYVALFSYLVLYSILTTLYLENYPAFEQPDTYVIENVAVKPITCSFSISSQYQKTPRYICYFLLIFTIIIRNYKWLAAGAAASVMTYSGVAAIHVIILFETGDRFKPRKAKLGCERLPIPGMSNPFFACPGVQDPDVAVAVAILSCVMLGALPMAALSRTFRQTTGRVILMFWLLLLAVGHTFDNLIWQDPNLQYQICPKDNIQPLPGFNYQAPLLDQSWLDSFHSLISATQQASQNVENGSSLACIYSCFASTAYMGRRQQDIGIHVAIDYPEPFIKNSAQTRLGGNMFWWLYTVLAFLSLFTTETSGQLPKWVHKRVFLLENCQQALGLRWTWKPVMKFATKSTNAPNTGSSEATDPKPCITIFTLVRFWTQFISVVVFCGSIVYLEVSNAPSWSTMELESFAAIGQWSNLAVVLLVLLAAVIRQLWNGGGTESAVIESMQRVEDGGPCSNNVTALDASMSNTEDLVGQDEDVETEVKDWSWRIGYAS